MKVLLKITQDGKTKGYKPVSINWMLTSYKGLVDALGRVGCKDDIPKSAKEKGKWLFFVSTGTESVFTGYEKPTREASEDALISDSLAEVPVYESRPCIDSFSQVGVLEGQVVYILNPETGQTIDIIRYEDL